VLRPGPADEIRCAIRVDAHICQHGVSRQRGDLGVGSHVPEQGGLNLRPEVARAQELAPIERLQRARELHEFLEVMHGGALGVTSQECYAQCIDDEGRIPEPVEEVVRVRVVVRRHGGGEDGPRPRDDPLPEPGTLHDEIGRRDRTQHPRGGDASLCGDPAIERR